MSAERLLGANQLFTGSMVNATTHSRTKPRLKKPSNITALQNGTGALALLETSDDDEA